MILNGITDWALGFLSTAALGLVGYFHTKLNSVKKTAERHETQIAVLHERLEGIEEKLEGHGGQLANLQSSVSAVGMAVARIEGRLDNE